MARLWKFMKISVLGLSLHFLLCFRRGIDASRVAALVLVRAVEPSGSSSASLGVKFDLNVLAIFI